MEVILSITAKVAEFTVVPIGHQLGYLIFYNRNMSELKGKVDNLVQARERVQTMVDEARSNSYRILSDVSEWLAEVDEIIELHKISKGNESEPNNKCSNVLCLNLIQRHQLSRKANKVVKEISEIIEKIKMFDKIGFPAPLIGIDSSSITGYQSIEARRVTANEIRDALADNNVNKVGVYGMGGVGKTMLIKEVSLIVKEEKLFDQVIIATIGQSLGTKNIQTKIGDMLRLKFDQESEEGRAALLRNKLEMENKILIVLDDVWKELNLDDIGVPYGDGKSGCKILITSRNLHVLTNQMCIQRNIEVKPLSEKESWNFFKNVIGDAQGNSIELKTRLEVAKKCGGLPIALCTVAKALKGKPLPIWKDALKQLENPVTVNLDGLSDEVYYSLELSYDFIKNEEAKFLFLLCSVFPDDYEICVKDLQMYAMGMGLLNEIYTWDEARNRIIKLVDDLVSSNLLIESNIEEEKYVKMHDVIRDVAIRITSRETRMLTLSYGCGLSEWKEKDRCGSYRAIFADCNRFKKLPEDLKFPRLELLILSRDGWRSWTRIPNTFFEGMKELKVLNLSCIRFPLLMTSLTQSLANLRILCLSRCEIADIDFIGELKTLEILKINSCLIEELPMTMSQLTKLEVLELSQCENLKVIPPNIISTLTKLQVLDLWSSFDRWDQEVSDVDKLIKNAGLSELKHLPHLTNLTLSIADGNIVPNNLLFSKNLNGYPHLTKLSISNNSKMQYLIGDQFCNYLSVLESLSLARMRSLENIIRMNVRENPFNMLRVIEVQRCNKLRNLFPFSIFKGLSDLHHILVRDCKWIDQIVVMENREEAVTFVCRSLSNLYLYDVHQLTRFGSKQLTDEEASVTLIPFFNDKVAFPELKRLRIYGANNLKMLWRNDGLISGDNSFRKLQSIKIDDCDNLSGYVFPCNVVRGLVLLRRLRVWDCALVEGIFEMEGFTDKEKDDKLVMALKDIQLNRLQNLKHVWNKDPHDFFTFPKLKNVYISGCFYLSRSFLDSFTKKFQHLSHFHTDENFSDEE